MDAILQLVELDDVMLETNIGSRAAASAATSFMSIDILDRLLVGDALGAVSVTAAWGAVSVTAAWDGRNHRMRLCVLAVVDWGTRVAMIDWSSGRYWRR
jgi:hypothetical protein